jgi:hypothetical protein
MWLVVSTPGTLEADARGILGRKSIKESMICSSCQIGHVWRAWEKRTINEGEEAAAVESGAIDMNKAESRQVGAEGTRDACLFQRFSAEIRCLQYVSSLLQLSNNKVATMTQQGVNIN